MVEPNGDYSIGHCLMLDWGMENVAVRTVTTKSRTTRARHDLADTAAARSPYS